VGTFFTSVASTLASIAHQYGMEAKLVEYRLQREWTRIAGDQMAAHTQPEAIRFKKLYLIADNSVWLQQIAFLKPVLIEKINAVAGKPIVSDLILRVGELSRKAEFDPKSESKPAAGGPAASSAEDYTQQVADPGLRAQLAAVMARALRREPDRPHG
jgi:hypothetical protein